MLVPDVAPSESEETAQEVGFGGLFSRRDREKKKTRDSDFGYDRAPPDAPETLAPSSKKLRLWNELAKPVVIARYRFLVLVQAKNRTKVTRKSSFAMHGFMCLLTSMISGP